MISLGVRRPLQITLDHFDFSGEGLTELDFAEEVERSQVYDTQTKWLLARTVHCSVSVCRGCIIDNYGNISFERSRNASKTNPDSTLDASQTD